MSGSAGISKCVRVRIEGRVQGVWFRAWTVQEATRRGLSGWVRNRRDGSVEAVLSGPADKVDDMIAACHRGPPAAAVSAVTQTAEAEQPAAGQFEQRATT
jgi:acylphosphatase